MGGEEGVGGAGYGLDLVGGVGGDEGFEGGAEFASRTIPSSEHRISDTRSCGAVGITGEIRDGDRERDREKGGGEVQFPSEEFFEFGFGEVEGVAGGEEGGEGGVAEGVEGEEGGVGGVEGGEVGEEGVVEGEGLGEGGGGEGGGGGE